MPATSPPRPPLGRLAARLVVGLAALVLVLVAGTGVASAHASLVSTTPADGQSVPTAPQIVSATFTESISADVGGLTVRNTDGDRVDEGNSSVSANTLQVTVPTDLPDGTYIATYRVLSADGHPVSGSWLFGVGTAPVDPSAAGPVGTGDAGLGGRRRRRPLRHLPERPARRRAWPSSSPSSTTSGPTAGSSCRSCASPPSSACSASWARSSPRPPCSPAAASAPPPTARSSRACSPTASAGRRPCCSSASPPCTSPPTPTGCWSPRC